MSYCPLCKMELGEIQQARRWIHDIIFHQEYWENYVIDLTKEQIIDALCDIVKTLYFDEN